MVVNFNLDNEHIKFIDYKYSEYNLCSGTLTLDIDGKTYKFGNEYESIKGKIVKRENIYPSFWETGGGFDENYNVITDDWIINTEILPEEIKKYAYEIGEIFNKNVPHGCCGGCL